MAKLFPDISKTRIVFASRAEEHVYNLCREKLGGSWNVFYSCTLSTMEKDDGMKANEIDFVLYHPRFGIVVIEVKGGRIRYEAESNNFYSVNRHGESFAIKNPFQQALVWKSRFVRLLRQQNLKAPVTHAVCFPNVSEEDFPKSAGVEPEIILGRNALADLEGALKRLVKMAQPDKFLQFEDVGSQLEKVLIGADFCTKLYFRDYIDSHELRVKDIESIQDSLITPVAGSKMLGVEGEAGTGKTMLALQLAKHFRDQGKRVLLLSSNSLLNLYLKDEAGQNVDVRTYEELANSYGIDFLATPADFSGTSDDWTQFEAPDRLTKAVEKSQDRFEVILSDEAQDVQPFWWDVIKKLLKDGEESRFYIFFDRSQGVFGSGGGDKRFIPEEVLPVEPPYFPLVNNYRTTREIATFSRAFRTGKQILQSHSARLGYLPEIVVYEDAADCQRLMGRLFRKLIKEEGLSSNEMTVLSARKPSAEGSVLSGLTEIAKFPLHFMANTGKNWRDSAPPRGRIPVSTIAGFKGLETSIGILVNLSEYNMPLTNPIMSSLVYVAATRAKHMLYIFVQKNDPKLQVIKAAQKAINTTGALVLEGGAFDSEFVGEVIHYNPDRAGWLSVDDPNFQKNSVIFFPVDIEKAEIEKVKVGDKLRFRTRVEGPVTIAYNLRRDPKLVS